MKKLILFVVFVVVFSGCSFKAQPDEWRYNSTNAFSSYTSNFLSDRDALARDDLKRAIKHAKQSADFSQLARIYLGKCALNISVGIDDSCSQYLDISEFTKKDRYITSYYHLLMLNIKKEDIRFLNANYQDFAKYLLEGDDAKLKKEIFDAKRMSSKLIGASLIKDKLNFDEINNIIDEASFYGYKKSVLYWLSIQKTKTTDISKIKAIEKKIKIMK